MRLINTSTLELREFVASPPRYAILSHTWGEEEVSFQAYQAGDCHDKAGYEKIKRCCAYAAQDGSEYVWIDTCCIDRTSSAELSESINSMFRWYQNAEICYVYLADVAKDSSEIWLQDFAHCRWFTRGWTLQELLAPDDVVFLDASWKDIGTKWSLASLISRVTQISDLRNYFDTNVAQKLSWLADRKTTRVEDMSYCMLGLFGINMPLIYGEGENAFRRLQLEILARDNDNLIFAWNQIARGVNVRNGDLLARTPMSFR